MGELLLAPQGNQLQQILVDEAARAVDAGVRRAGRRARDAPLSRALRAALVDAPLSPLKPLARSVDALIAEAEGDAQALGAVESLWSQVHRDDVSREDLSSLTTTE